jgi:23S rRNA pseudouridine1911/1915/1917 synthase
MKILFEDNHLLILDKPFMLATQPTPHDADSLLTHARAFLKERDQKPGNVFLEPIHRLDKAVGGVVIFAKTSKALSRMTAFIREKKWKKTYHAVVSGHPPEEGRLEDFLRHDAFRAVIDPEGKFSVLSYKVVKRLPRHSHLEIDLESGRYHQIRVQLSSRGYPIVGDMKYGSHEKAPAFLPTGAISLLHYEVVCFHPITKAALKICSTQRVW